MSKQNIDQLLSKRGVPPVSSNLASRIIAAAEIQRDVPFYQIVIQEILSMIILPRPAYALAIFLFFGLIIGLQIQISGDTAEMSSQELFSFLEIQEGDWL